MPVAYIVDSTSNIKNGEIQDVFVVPLLLNTTIKKNVISYKDGIDINTHQLIERMLKGEVFKTSSPIMNDCLAMIEKLQKEYDKIIVLSVSKAISGTYQQWKLLASDFDNVSVYSLPVVGEGVKWIINDLKKIEKDSKKVDEYMNNCAKKNHICVVLLETKYLVRGGRLSLLKSMMASLFKMKIVVELTDEGLRAAGKSPKKKGLWPIVEKINKSSINMTEKNIDKVCLFTSQTDGEDNEQIMKIKDLIEQEFGSNKIINSELPSIIVAHVGPNYLAISVKVK